MTVNTHTESSAELNEEIEILRALINSVSNAKTNDSSLSEKVHQLNAVGRNDLILARLLQIQKNLRAEPESPADLLRQSLLELEEEWPEFKKMVERYSSAHPKSIANPDR